MQSITYTGTNVDELRRFTGLHLELDSRDGTLWVNELDNPGTDSTLCVAVGDSLTERIGEDGWRHFDQVGKGHRRLAALEVQWRQACLNGSTELFGDWLNTRLDAHLAQPRKERLDNALANLDRAEETFEAHAADNVPELVGLTEGFGR